MLAAHDVGTQPASSNQVATIVAMTLQAVRQIYGTERDGKRVAQLTAESVDVSDYDVSLAFGPSDRKRSESWQHARFALNLKSMPAKTST